MIAACCFQGYRKAGDGEMGIRHVKNATELTILTKKHPFSLNKCYCNSLLFISRVLRKLIWTIFAHILIAFMEEMIFRDLYSAIFADDQHVAL